MPTAALGTVSVTAPPAGVTAALGTVAVSQVSTATTSLGSVTVAAPAATATKALGTVVVSASAWYLKLVGVAKPAAIYRKIAGAWKAQ